MAVADLAQLLICAWIFLLKDFYQNYLLGTFGCKFEGFLECKLIYNQHDIMDLNFS